MKKPWENVSRNSGCCWAGIIKSARLHREHPRQSKFRRAGLGPRLPLVRDSKCQMGGYHGYKAHDKVREAPAQEQSDCSLSNFSSSSSPARQRNKLRPDVYLPRQLSRAPHYTISSFTVDGILYGNAPIFLEARGTYNPPPSRR